jgi:hypothetical protein
VFQPTALRVRRSEMDTSDSLASWSVRISDELPHSRRYRLANQGYSICVLFLKLFERIYAPLTAGLLSPAIATSPRTNVVNLTASINRSPTISTLSCPQSDSRPLLNQSNENKILVSRCIID